MNPVNLGFDNCDLNSVQKILDKETQTGQPEVISGSKSSICICKDNKSATQLPKTPSGGADVPNKGSQTLFEFCQILQDPKSPRSVTIVKETLSQEVLKHSTKGTSDEGVANRYKYCKEVIEPYIKPYESGCEQSEEELLKDVLDSVQQDFPDYQPCISNYPQQTPIELTPSVISKVDAVTSFDSKSSKGEMDANDACKPQKPVEPTKIVQRPGCFPKNVDTPSGVPDPGCNIKVEQKPAETPEKPEETKKSPCPPKTKPVPRVCEPSCEAECAEKPVVKKSAKKKSTDECPPPIDYCKKRSEQSFGQTKPIPPEQKPSFIPKPPKPAPAKEDVSETDSQCETLSQIKTAMEDFITKVYTTTQDTVELIKTESAKQFEKFSKSCCEIESDDKNSENKDKVSCGTRSAGKVIENLFDKVDSTICKISDSMDYKKLPEKMRPKCFNDESSEYDIPTAPKEIAHIIVQTSITSNNLPVPQSSSVFATIKDKICSLFCDDEKKIGSESNCSTNFSRQTENDEDSDLIDRLIE